MNYGLYISAAGTLTSLHRQDALANNLANINTAGFKPDEVQFRARLPERLESLASAGFIDPHVMLEQLGGGVLADPTRISLAQGDLTQTNNSLDVAIQGDGFFVVQNGKEGDAADTLRLTRDGRFTRNAQGDLVLATNGLRVMDANNRPIRLNATGPVRIDADGTLMQNEQPVARLRITAPTDSRDLQKDGANLLRFARAGALKQGDGIVRQGFIESSGVDPIVAMNKMINASKAVQANATMMQYHDNILGQAVNTFGRVA